MITSFTRVEPLLPLSPSFLICMSFGLALGTLGIRISDKGPRTYLLRVATGVCSKLARWSLPLLLVRVLHLQWTWTGHVLHMNV